MSVSRSLPWASDALGKRFTTAFRDALNATADITRSFVRHRGMIIHNRVINIKQRPSYRQLLEPDLKRRCGPGESDETLDLMCWKYSLCWRFFRNNGSLSSLRVCLLNKYISVLSQLVQKMSWIINKQEILLIISPELSVSSRCTMFCDGQDEEDSALSVLCLWPVSTGTHMKYHCYWLIIH